MKKIYLFLFIFFLFLFLQAPNLVFACPAGCAPADCSSNVACQVCSFCGGIPGEQNLGEFEGLGPLGKPIATPDDPGTSAFTKFLSTAVGIMTVIAFIWFLFTFFGGTIAWLSSGGDKQKLQNAQKQITTAVIGLVIVISALFLIRIIGVVFGLDILNLTEIIKNL